MKQARHCKTPCSVPVGLYIAVVQFVVAANNRMQQSLLDRIVEYLIAVVAIIALARQFCQGLKRIAS
eukprot:scaffold252544_cov20-Prasinocladus_malaysianus.AAC.1